MIKKYEKYKESNDIWLGKIPEHWDVSSLKHFVEIINGYAFKSEDYSDDIGVPIIRIGDISSLLDVSKAQKASPKNLDELERFIIKREDLLLAMTGATIGKTCMYETDDISYVNQRVGIVRGKALLSQSFLKYYIDTPLFREFILLACSGSAQENISSSQVGSLRFSLPPLSEQTAIARYLDHQTAIIDQLIQQKEKLVELLKEKRQATINEAVTKGLNPNAKMKDSGIEWLGEVPEEWEVVKLKYLVSLNSNEEISIENSFKVALENIESGTGKFIESGSGNQFEGIGNSFKKGDVLFNKLRPYLSKVYLSQQDGYSVGELLVLTPNDAITSEFLFYRLLSSAFIEIVNSSTYGAKMPRASWNFIGNLLIPVPSIDEQLKIVSFIQNFDAKANNLITQTFTQISKLKEYRQSIISEAVTGKVDVREWAAGKKETTA